MKTLWTRRFTFLAPAALLLAACGYQPVYQHNDGAFRDITIAKIAMAEEDVEYGPGQRRLAQMVRQQLEQNLPTQDGAVLLYVKIEEEQGSLAVRRDATDLRRKLVARAHIELQDMDGDVLYKNYVTSSVAYNVEDSPFGTDAGQDYARRAAANALAEELMREMARWQARQPATN